MVAGALLGLFPNIRLTAWHAFGSLAFIPHRSPSNGEIWPILVQGWTLNYEMFFYAVFGLVLLLPERRRFVALTSTLAALVAVGLLFPSENPLLKTYTDPRLLEFLMGTVIGKCWLDKAVPSRAAGIALIVLAIAGFAFVGVTYIGFNAYVFAALASALVAGVLGLEKGAAVGHFKPVAYLGDGSYSIYLWHAMAISVVAKAGVALAIPGPVVLIIAIISGVLVGAAAHEILEKPVAALLRQSPDGAWKRVLAGARFVQTSRMFGRSNGRTKSERGAAVKKAVFHQLDPYLIDRCGRDAAGDDARGLTVNDWDAVFAETKKAPPPVRVMGPCADGVFCQFNGPLGTAAIGVPSTVFPVIWLFLNDCKTPLVTPTPVALLVIVESPTRTCAVAPSTSRPWPS